MNVCVVLLLEDNPDEVYLIDKALRRSEVTSLFVPVRSVSEAQDYLLGKGIYHDRAKYPMPNLALVDVRLGPDSGLDFVRWAKAQNQFAAVQLVVFTGSHYPKAMDEARDTGAASVEQKPAEFGELIKKDEILKANCTRKIDAAA